MATAERIQPESRLSLQTTRASSRDRKYIQIEQGYEAEACAVILTAQNAERDSLFDHFTAVPVTKDCKVWAFQISEFNEGGIFWHIAVANVGPGSENAALAAAHAIQCFRPEIILFCGTACGISKDILKHGHVVVVELAYDVVVGIESPNYSLKNKKRKIQRSDENVIELAKKCIEHKDWKKRVKEKTNKRKLVAHTGPVATTGSIVASRDADTFKRIVKWYPKAVAVEQEAYGFLHAAKIDNICAIVIRGIADFCEEDWENAGPAGFKRRAMVNASAFVFELLAKINLSLCRQ